MMNKVATILLCINFITVLFPQPGYIHPDEFFQSPEIVAGDVLNVTHYRAWEFDASFPVRSIVFPYLLTSPPLYLLRFLNSSLGSGIQISTTKVIMSTRLPIAFLNVLGYLATGKLASTFSVNKYLSTVLYCSSYVSWTYFTRTFSNTTESVLLAVVFLLILPQVVNEENQETKRISLHERKIKIRQKDTEFKENKGNESSISRRKEKITEKNKSIKTFVLGMIVAAGIFNRPTFIVFAFIPLLFWFFRKVSAFQSGWYYVLVEMSLSFSFGLLLSSAMFICADTAYYKPDFVFSFKRCFNLLFWGEISASLFQEYLNEMLSYLVFTPLNFFLYNTNSSNLSKHGLHPQTLHFFINLPLLLGPVYLAFISVTTSTMHQLLSTRLNSNKTTMQPAQLWLVLMAAVPVLVLSIFPHQEPRFLIPALPVFMVMGAKVLEAMAPAKFSFIAVWAVFNFVLTLFYGYLHQGALVPAMSIYQQKLSSISSSSAPTNHHVIFYKTYPPPRHLLLLPNSSSSHVHIYDLAGGPVTSVKDVVLDSKAKCRRKKGSCQIFIFMPATVTARMESHLSNDFKIHITSICPHLSMETTPRLMAWWRKKIEFREFIMEFCLNIAKIT